MIYPSSIVRQLRDDGALFVVNHSGGKDSQAMMIELLRIVPREQIVVVHAALGEVEWEGALELAQQQAHDAGCVFLVARAQRSLLDMVVERFENRPDVPSWPSSSTRQCTSDLKRGPCQREVRRYAERMAFRTIVNCMGLRAEESASRAKKSAFVHNKAQSNGRRQWFDWLPIHDLTTAEVFARIADAGQQPHWAYADGNERLSCVFCIFGSANDIAHGARRRPELFAKYVALEKRTGYTMHMSRKSLTELVAEATI